ncbi:MAG: histidine phosphatase family protein [bacterium]|nr:histidine phosphatase family protein [bacterium]
MPESPKTTIYFVRHAQAENPNGIYYGRMPGFHLSSEGREQAKKLGEYFKDKPIEIIYTSPLERTYETANIISESLPKVNIIHDYDLIEVNMIGWQSLKYDEALKNEEHEHFMNDSLASLQGENLTQISERMKQVAAGICQKHAGRQIICVTHEFPISALELRLKNQPLEEIKAINKATGSITKIVLDEACNLVESDYIELS